MDAESRFRELSTRLADARSSGIQSQSAEQLLAALQKDVRELVEKRDTLETAIADRTMHLEKLQSWESSDRVTTEDDVRLKRSQLSELRHEADSTKERLDAALERNSKLEVFRQASTIALSKLREKEEELEKLNEDKRRLNKQIEEKELQFRSQGKNNSLKSKRVDMNKYGAQVRDKIERYKKMREELASQRAELVILQRTENVLKSKHKNLDDFLNELERKKGVEVRAYVYLLPSDNCMFRNICRSVICTLHFIIVVRENAYGFVCVHVCIDISVCVYDYYRLV